MIQHLFHVKSFTSHKFCKMTGIFQCFQYFPPRETKCLPKKHETPGYRSMFRAPLQVRDQVQGQGVYICIWRYPVDFAVHYNIHYITFTILVRETWNDYQTPYVGIFTKDTIGLNGIFGKPQKRRDSPSLLHSAKGLYAIVPCIRGVTEPIKRILSNCNITAQQFASLMHVTFTGSKTLYRCI